MTLINDRRVVSVSAGSTPDVSTIHTTSSIASKTVTGGQSAIYGSGTIAGVANFILRRDCGGVRLRAGGISTYGDRGTYLVSALAGKKGLMDGRLNIRRVGQYTRERIYRRSRISTGAYGGVPGFILADHHGTEPQLRRHPQHLRPARHRVSATARSGGTVG